MTKKTLYALAVASLAVGAHAQSSVTIFGVADVGVTYGTGSRFNNTLVSSSNTLPSRIGFRGQEDLGNNLYATFWLEGSLAVDTGQGGTTSTNNQSTGAGTQALFNRRSTVSLLSKRFGELRLGRDLTPQVFNHVMFDPFSNVGVGASQAYNGYRALYSVGPVSGVDTRASNTVGYLLPSSAGGGFGGQVQYWMGENASNTVNARDGSGAGMRLTYASGPVSLGVAAAKTSYLAGDQTTYNAGGYYDFGVVRLTGYYDRTKNGVVTGKGWLLGGDLPVGMGRFKGAVSRFSQNSGTQPTSTKLALGYEHFMSKRTLLYGTVARLTNKGGATQALGGALTNANDSSSGIDIGIRTSF
ncbi:Outer membrane protein (porin) [Polaromonas sp. OV174]|uniref:porin n=1 Tax=Polaromonas sp. OV174 TaxID=1855300 RepID=UPI0008E0C30C|nr:porin [Polaromonas sp. OV174]SFB89671.1 Outer membrane protein (porin) [Polaromonas sp. OV174]